MKRKTSESPFSFFKIHASLFALFTVCFWLSALVDVLAGRLGSPASVGMFFATRLLINLMWGAAVFHHYQIDQQISKQTQAQEEQYFEEMEKVKREHKAVLDPEAEAADGMLIDEAEWHAQHRLQSK